VFSDPLYIIGTERSGSNLLRVILGAHPHIDVPHPPHIMRYFSPLAPGYGDLSVAANLRRLAGDVDRLLRIHIYPWDVPIDIDRAATEARPRSLLGLTCAIYEQHREATGKARWGNKSTFMLDHTDAVLERDPGAKLIWLVRDPRDVAVSSRKSVFSPYHPYHTAQLWQRQQARGLALAARLPEQTLHRLRYEDLLADPEGRLREVCDFLDEPFTAELLSFSQTAAAKKGAGLSESWANTGRPLMTGNTGKWRTQLSAEEAAVVETVCAGEMDALGYSLEGGARSPGLRDRARYRLQGARWQLGVEWRSLRHDDNHWRRWGRAALMGSLRLS